jgi:hypothetical protein
MTILALFVLNLFAPNWVQHNITYPNAHGVCHYVYTPYHDGMTGYKLVCKDK